MSSSAGDFFNPVNHLNPFSKKNPGNIFHSGSAMSNFLDPFTRPMGLRLTKEDPRIKQLGDAHAKQLAQSRAEQQRLRDEAATPFQVRRRAQLSSESLGTTGRRASQYLAG